MKDSKHPPLRKTSQHAEKSLKCCVCDTNKHETFYKEINNYELVRCKGCGLVYLKSEDNDINFINDAQNDLHSSEKEKIEYWSFPDYYENYKMVFELFFEDRLRKIKEFSPKPESMLDIGCGYGFWMKYCKENGLSVHGIDPSQETVDWAVRDYDLNAERTIIEEFVTDKSYDIIVLCDVLEHLRNPLLQLERINGFLKHDGILYIQVPNLLGFKLPFRHGFGLPHHIWQFSIQPLTKLLKKSGFTVVKYHTGVQGVIGAYERGGPSVKELTTWWMARTFKIGNRLQVIARKD
jgi:2-polyprenyl-3-methyl-5-hydroxy-6-metoxy-1,4-benzoquinol methylase